ncbi:sensor domain-containing protein [Salinispora oceanensis]|uniref:sensor domain-containing protein n=1 Tax=Salinispora oceanensis TaxID=1050199 RepID=UPI00035FBCB3|nr:sensor domain-containing protein [Salinispora oceanensis]
MATQLARSARLRWRLLGWAFVLVALALVEVLVLTWAMTTLTLAVLWVTVPLFTGAVLAARAMADSRRRFVARELGIAVERRYRPLPAANRWARFRTVLRDPASWRDLRWLFVDATAGLVLLTVPVATFGAGLLGVTMARNLGERWSVLARVCGGRQRCRLSLELERRPVLSTMAVRRACGRTSC